MYPRQPEALLFWTIILLMPRYKEGHLMKREVRCPVYDSTWKIKNDLCPKEEAYHCFEDENYHVVTDECFKPKVCRHGSHPVEEGEGIVCALCQTGFQRQDNLKSNEYRVSYCDPHSRPCDPEYGQSECQPATRERDRACTCNATLGFSPATNSLECQCFNPNSACAGCRFTGCPDGSVKNEKGFCELEKATTAGVTVLPPEQPTPPPNGRGDSHLALAIAIPLVLLAIIGGSVFLFCWRRKRQRAERVSGERQGQLMSEEQNTPQTNGSTNHYGVRYVENMYINGRGDVGVEVGITGGIIFGEHNTINGTSENNNPHPGEVPALRSNRRSRPESPAASNLSNGQLPSGTTESGQSLQPQESSHPSAPADAVPAEFSPTAANHESAPPPLPTAPNLPLDPSAPPPSILAEDRGPVAETGEDADETFVKTILPAAEEATDVETQPKVPYSLYDETDLKKPLLLDHEQTECKTPIPV